MLKLLDIQPALPRQFFRLVLGAISFQTHYLKCVWLHASPGCTRGDVFLWPRRTGVCPTFPLPGNRAARSGRRRLTPKLVAKT